MTVAVASMGSTLSIESLNEWISGYNDARINLHTHLPRAFYDGSILGENYREREHFLLADAHTAYCGALSLVGKTLALSTATPYGRCQIATVPPRLHSPKHEASIFQELDRTYFEVVQVRQLERALEQPWIRENLSAVVRRAVVALGPVRVHAAQLAGARTLHPFALVLLRVEGDSQLGNSRQEEARWSHFSGAMQGFRNGEGDDGSFRGWGHRRRRC